MILLKVFFKIIYKAISVKGVKAGFDSYNEPKSQKYQTP